jgi:hypothetical protein
MEVIFIFTAALLVGCITLVLGGILTIVVTECFTSSTYDHIAGIAFKESFFDIVLTDLLIGADYKISFFISRFYLMASGFAAMADEKTKCSFLRWNWFFFAVFMAFVITV